MNWTDLGTIGAIITALGGLWVSWSTRRQQDAEATNSLTATAMALVEPLKVELHEERTKRLEMQAAIEAITWRVKVLQERNDELISGVRRLVHQIRALGHAPVYEPKFDTGEIPTAPTG